jgi:Domain of unknown function (DUF4351)
MKLLLKLNRSLGSITPELEERVQQLAIKQLRDLGEALLDFSAVSDLESWLITNDY